MARPAGSQVRLQGQAGAPDRASRASGVLPARRFSGYPSLPGRGVLSKSHIDPASPARRLRIEATYPVPL